MGGQHDGHVPFWFPALNSLFISLSLRVFACCWWSEYTTLAQNDTRAIVYTANRGVLGFLELINNMLTSGMVPALYNDEEKEQVIGQVCQNYLFFFHIFILADRGSCSPVVINNGFYGWYHGNIT